MDIAISPTGSVTEKENPKKIKKMTPSFLESKRKQVGGFNDSF